jgi:hypothetical protein
VPATQRFLDGVQRPEDLIAIPVPRGCWPAASHTTTWREDCSQLTPIPAGFPRCGQRPRAPRHGTAPPIPIVPANQPPAPHHTESTFDLPVQHTPSFTRWRTGPASRSRFSTWTARVHSPC